MPFSHIHRQGDSVKARGLQSEVAKLQKSTMSRHGVTGLCGGSVRKNEDEVEVGKERENGKSCYG